MLNYKIVEIVRWNTQYKTRFARFALPHLDPLEQILQFLSDRLNRAPLLWHIPRLLLFFFLAFLLGSLGIPYNLGTISMFNAVP